MELTSFGDSNLVPKGWATSRYGTVRGNARCLQCKTRFQGRKPTLSQSAKCITATKTTSILPSQKPETARMFLRQNFEQKEQNIHRIVPAPETHDYQRSQQVVETGVSLCSCAGNAWASHELSTICRLWSHDWRMTNGVVQFVPFSLAVITEHTSSILTLRRTKWF